MSHIVKMYILTWICFFILNILKGIMNILHNEISTVPRMDTWWINTFLCFSSLQTAKKNMLEETALKADWETDPSNRQSGYDYD